MEADDLEELRVCMGKISQLEQTCSLREGVEEFAAYRVLLHLQPKSSKGGSYTLEISQMLREMDRGKRESLAVKHALAVWRSVASHDYHAFFRLYDRAPNMSAFLMDDLADQMRDRFLRVLIRTHRAKYPLATFMRVCSIPSVGYALPLLKEKKIVVDAGEEAIDIDKTKLKWASLKADKQPKASNLAPTPRQPSCPPRKTIKEAMRALELAVIKSRSIVAPKDRKKEAMRLIKQAKQLLTMPGFDPSMGSLLQRLLQQLRGMKKRKSLPTKKIVKKQNMKKNKKKKRATKKFKF